MAGSVWCSCHRGSFHVQVPRPWPETTVGAGGLRHCLVQPHPAQAWKIHSEGKGTTSGASEMLLEFCCACLCHSFVPFLLFKGAKWKTPFFGCLFSLLMRRHLEILLRFQPIPLASFNFRRGLVVLLACFSSELFTVYKDHTQCDGNSLDHPWEQTQRKVTVIAGTLRGVRQVWFHSLKYSQFLPVVHCPQYAVAVLQS